MAGVSQKYFWEHYDTLHMRHFIGIIPFSVHKECYYPCCTDEVQRGLIRDEVQRTLAQGCTARGLESWIQTQAAQHQSLGSSETLTGRAVAETC